MDVSTDGFTELLLKSFFSFLLCTYFPQLLQGSRKPSQECNLSPATSILLGPLSLQAIRQGMSPGRGALPLQAPGTALAHGAEGLPREGRSAAGCAAGSGRHLTNNPRRRLGKQE